MTILTKAMRAQSGWFPSGGSILVSGTTLATAMFAYYDSDADIAWSPPPDSDLCLRRR